jgi:hypothetical protein
MADTIKTVVGDELPVITLTLTDESTGSVVDLSAGTTTVSVEFYAAGTTTILSTISCGKVGDGTAGQVTFSFVGGVLDVDAGAYEGNIVIDYNGSEQTVYDTLRFRVRAAVG